jgi:anti-sigma-K factor RskA
MNDEDLDLARGYALDALDESELRAAELLRSSPNPNVRAAFEDEVRKTRETMATVGVAFTDDPPPRLRQRLLESINSEPISPPSPVSLEQRRKSRGGPWRIAAGVAAALVLVLGGVLIGDRLRDNARVSTADVVLAAPDVHSSCAPLDGGGSATVVYSRQANAAVLVLNNVPKPAADRVVQMWLIRGTGTAPESAGTIDILTDATSATVNGLGTAGTLAFSVEPPGGSPQPTTAPFGKITLS